MRIVVANFQKLKAKVLAKMYLEDANMKTRMTKQVEFNMVGRKSHCIRMKGIIHIFR